MESRLMVFGLLFVVIFPYIHTVNPAAQNAIITPKTIHGQH
jgi:hypothetical protein